ncbi:hypothetical protein ACF0H5_010938 [Mactra antiquata]
MSLFVPVVHDLQGDSVDAQIEYSSNKGWNCEKCFTWKSNKKIRKLPGCQHVLCVKCIEKSVNETSTWVDGNDNTVPCPSCGKESTKLDLSLLIKSDKSPTMSRVSKTSILPAGRSESSDLLNVNVRSDLSIKRQNKTRFYTQSEFHQPVTKKQTDQVTPRSSAMARLGGHRSAVRYSRHENYNGFQTKLSTDTNRCLYFNGDRLEGGYTILADWRNRVLKVYSKSGQYVCASEKLDDCPLDVTVISYRVIVVTFGARIREIAFLSYDFSKGELSVLGTAKNMIGFLYATTKMEDKCVGIYEVDQKPPCLALIDVSESAIKSGSFRKTVKNWTMGSHIPVSSESGLHYCQNNKMLYVTNRRALYCYGQDMKLLYKKSYDNIGKDLYILGSIASDDNANIYIASDQCVLRVNVATGSLQSIVPIDMDPYHIVMGHDRTFLIIMGDQDNVHYCMLQEEGDNLY